MKRDLVIGIIAAAMVAAIGFVALRWTTAPPLHTASAPTMPTASAPASPNPPSGATAPRQAGEAPAASVAISPTINAKPSFDVVRVNPHGEAVIAGRAAPGADVSLYDGSELLGHATADSHGEWVLLPKEALPPGNHQLSLAARSLQDGSTSRSDGVVAMLVPDWTEPAAGPRDDAVALLVPPNGPARPLQPSAAGHQKLTLDVIEYDADGNVQIVGRASPNTRIEVYLDDKPVGSAVANAAGDWLATLNGAVPVGRYQLRVEAPGQEAKLVTTFDRAATTAGFASVEVQRGNNLWRIAQRSYGNGLRYAEIFEANRRQIRDPNLIYPGQVFAVPRAR